MVGIYLFTYQRITSSKNAASVEAVLHLQVGFRMHKTGKLAQLLHHYMKDVVWKWFTRIVCIEQLRDQGRLKNLIGFEWR